MKNTIERLKVLFTRDLSEVSNPLEQGYYDGLRIALLVHEDPIGVVAYFHNTPPLEDAAAKSARSMILRSAASVILERDGNI